VKLFVQFHNEPILVLQIPTNARFFDSPDEVPRTALSQGIGTITEAAEIILVANGVEKAAAVARSIEGPRDSQVPASVLQTHPHITYALDEAAASKLTAKTKPRLVSDW
jgi:glucosamine-6-phosphate deaminase